MPSWLCPTLHEANMCHIYVSHMSCSVLSFFALLVTSNRRAIVDKGELECHTVATLLFSCSLC